MNQVVETMWNLASLKAYGYERLVVTNVGKPRLANGEYIFDLYHGETAIALVPVRCNGELALRSIMDEIEEELLRIWGAE